MRPTFLLFILVGSLLSGCDTSFTRPQRSPPDALAATAILNPYADTQGVSLSTVADPLPSSEKKAAPVQGAEVHVDEVHFEEQPVNDSVLSLRRYPEQSNYKTSALDVRPGSTYALHVEKGKHELSGTVAVPDTFRGWSNGRRLVWTKSRGAARYRVHVEDAANTSFEYLKNEFVSDTTLLLENAQSGSYYVKVTAQDTNLTAFMRNDTDRAGVEGGYGVFGAQLRIAGTVELAGKTAVRSGGPGSVARRREEAPLH